MIPDLEAMQTALAEARLAGEAGEVPIGAVVVHQDVLIAQGQNRVVRDNDPSAHAEIVALRGAAKVLGNYRLGGCSLYVTLEPCAMCIGAVLNARVSRVVFGAWDQKAGACGSVADLPRQPNVTHRVDVFGGVCSDESAALLRRFFEARR